MANKKEQTKSTTQASGAFTDIRVTTMEKDSLRGMASAKVAGMIWITGLRVIEGKNGLFVSMPSRKTSSGEYQDVYFPGSKDVRDELQAQVLEAYHAEVAKTANAPADAKQEAHAA